MAGVQEEKRKMVLSVAELAYYCYFAVMTFAKGMGLYDGMWPYTAALCMGAVLIICRLALTEHTLAEWLFVLGLTGMGVLIWYNSGQKGALIYITMIVAMKNVPVKRLFSIGLVIWGLTFAAQTLLTITGLKSDIFVVHEKLGLGFLIRWSLGQPHPNVLQITFLMLCALILYLADLKGKKLIYTTLGMLAANLYVFFYSVSYTGIILVVIYLFANLYLAYRKELCRIEESLIMLVFPACAAFAVLGPVVFSGKLWELCNKVLNTRFHIAKTHLTTDSLTLFGARPSDAIPAGLQNIDSSYVFALMRYGVVFFGLMCAGYMALVWFELKQKRYRELAIVIGFAVAAIAEPFFVNPSYKNISLLFLGAFVFEKFECFAKEKPEHVLNRTFLLCSFGKKAVEIPVEAAAVLWDSMISAFIKHKKAILIWGLAAGAAAGIFFAVTAKMPSAYYALRTSTQVKEDAYILLDLENLPEDFEGKILNYRDKETPMQKFEGNISKVEYVRGIVSSTLWCSVLAGLLCLVIYTWREYTGRRDKCAQKESVENTSIRRSSK